MSKALRIKIIDYLREKDATTKYVDIRAELLSSTDSVEHRKEVKATLDFLSNNKLIIINGSYEFLLWTGSNGLYKLDSKIISTKLTPKGETYHPENEADEMEATPHPVLATTHRSQEIKNVQTATGETQADVVIAEKPQHSNYPLSTPVALAVVDEVAHIAPEEPVTLPWYTPQAPEPVEADIVHPAHEPITQPLEARKEPIVYKFPPVDFKSESIVKPASPMVIEILNENLSSGIDAISNIKINRPAALTGDFEKDVNIILKFVLVVVLFLFFACIVWLYLG